MVLQDMLKQITYFITGCIYIFAVIYLSLLTYISSSESRGVNQNGLYWTQNSDTCEMQITQLAGENERLLKELNFYKYENKELHSHLSSLSGQCGTSSGCRSESLYYPAGHVWYPDPCTTCRCENGNTNCYLSHHSAECLLECNENTCLNGGICHRASANHSVQCICPDGFSGPLCEQSVSSCTAVKMEGNCAGHQIIWYFDSFSNQCKSTDSGCFLPGTTFSSFEACSLSCMQGTCCYRMKIGDIHDMVCQAETMTNCQMLCQVDDVEVLGFYPGIKCPENGCAFVASKFCHSGMSLYSPGSTFSFGCDTCECLDDNLLCSCHALSMRKEIREFSSTERIEYQNAIARLLRGGEKSIWTTLRNLYVTHIMHANSPMYFLFWNRIFVRTMERYLQEYSCSITIPYFDFTLDSGSFSSSPIWRSDFFGSPTADPSNCQEYFIMGSDTAWTPCIRRELKNNITAPTMVDIALALAETDFLEFTATVQGISEYLHHMIGGDMETTSSPHDPIFYSLHAYIDLLFWKWQNRHFSIEDGGYVTNILHSNLVPFNIQVQFLVDIEESLCYTYSSTPPFQENYNNVNGYGCDREALDPDLYRSSETMAYSSNNCFESNVKTVLYAGQKIQSILYSQEESFLKNLPRTCEHRNISRNVINEAWGVQPDDFAVSNFQPVDWTTEWSDQFCFTADIFLHPQEQNPAGTSCSNNFDNQLQIPICDESSLLKCPYYTYVPCKLSLCGNCSLMCHVNGQDIDCGDEKTDFCNPNPCKNGGLCKPSEWPSLPHLVTCECSPGFEGEFCEHASTHRCSLPKDSGKLIKNCGEPQKRWYFDLQKQECYSFYYQGCMGNSNNFPSLYDCRISCIIGACCWRSPLHLNRVPGFSEEGYDRYGFNAEGISKNSERRASKTGFGGEKAIFRFNGFDFQGYNKEGYNAEGLDRQGYNSKGYHHITKFNLTGFDAFGDHDGIIDFDRDGYDSDGYNRAGFNCYGYSKAGWDSNGLSAGWSFNCRAMNLRECQKIEKQFSYLQNEVIAFTPGKKCEEVECEAKCGCSFINNNYSPRSKFPLGCGTCECTLSGHISCPCTSLSMRKEIRDMTPEEMQRYQKAIKALALKKSPLTWQNLTHLYHQHVPHSRGGPMFLPWHRYFLRLVEMKLQEIDCSVTIPYFDWTMDVGSLETSVVWQANYFGGNGDKTRGNCVRNHPFKNHYSLYWDDCLRREFNTSVHLPNAVELENITRIQSFDELSAALDTLSGLFHLFVGGHMATLDAAYDPIFFSHYAFIDKLWYDWISENPDNVRKFPLKYRYRPLIPFAVLPDDTFLSDTQLCVTYHFITEGAPCVYGTSFKAGHHLAYQIKSKLTDIDGYDSKGYDSSGHDRMGWTRNGFYRDSFNRDAYDVHGFDRKGFNRYGFDRNGCNSKGFCFNESPYDSYAPFKSNVYENYNELGFRFTGFDFHGYDTYGFDSHGFDKNNCSYFFKGPFYPIFMKHAKKKLKMLPKTELNNVKRICSPVTTIPKWWQTINWLNRKKELNYKEILFPYHSEGKIPSFFDFKGAWLAPVPDERFCFHLHHHSKCDLNHPPVTCPFKACSSALCPSVPSARCRSFGCGSCDSNYFNIVTQKPTSCNNDVCLVADGSNKLDGEVWEDDSCNTCSCQAGLVSCSSMVCEPDCDHPIAREGYCCPVCDGCMKNNIAYENDEEFVDPENPCLKCHCKNGSIMCSALECPPVKPCRQNAVVILDGECCPFCSTCGPHHEGSYWMESPCHNCTCQAGNVLCSVIDCPMPSCQYPARAVGECCRHCDDCEYRGSYVKNEELFNPESCMECKCQKGNITCHKIDCSHSLCNFLRSEYEHCCTNCNQGCQYDGKYYKDGSIFLPTFNPCLNCSCKKGLVRCLPVTCPEPDTSCERPVFPPGGCCPMCPKCFHENREYFNGDSWKASDDPCKICTCLDGSVMCSYQEICSEKKCSHGVIPVGACCSPCIDCQYNSHVVLDKMQFSPPGDPCSRCICKKGNITCVRETCPKLLCVATELPQGSCCPVCKGCLNSNGQYIEHGRKWTHSNDICQVCSCDEGVIKCDRVLCDVPCTHPVRKPDVCCAECRDCQVLGVVYPNSVEIPTSDDCKKCFCFNGNMECESVSCATVTCENPKVEPGRCCPSCEECNFQGIIYQDGEKFHPKSDSCYFCTCDKGAVSCERKMEQCNPQCTDPVKLPGQCCPVCDGCEYEGKVLKNKERFSPNPLNLCLQCECINGNVKCSEQQCPKLSCPNPIKPEKQCCEECVEYCRDRTNENIQHNEGDVWVSTENPCEICTCKDSVVLCERTDCPPVHCQHAAAPFGVCCPECEHCEFTHRLYRNGEEFTHRDDPCQICKCQNGSVFCETVFCDSQPCMEPEVLEGLCCPICPPEMKCRYLGKTYMAWENFMDPENACSECVCLEGMVSCHPVLCSNTECPNPQFGSCCETCDGCSYGEKNYINHAFFHDPYNPCRECQCDSGTVSCQQRSCDSPVCKDPALANTECCSMCQDCMFKDGFFRHGENFTDPDDPCVKCSCQFSQVICEEHSCPEESCTNSLSSACCEGPFCSDCQFFEDMYTDGEVFTHPHDPCAVCICQSGHVTCFEQCPDIFCTHPVKTSCCNSCNDGCSLGNIVYDDYQVFRDTDNDCQECVCLKGNITCKRISCPTPSCKHPSSDGCCSVCDDCFYKNEHFMNGESIYHDSSDACQVCTCMNGNIECKFKTCATVHCSNPVIEDCCPVCHLGCLYDGEIYSFGAEFDHPNDPCYECACMEGSVQCSKKPCGPLNCSNAIYDSESCCPHCPNYCISNSKKYDLNSIIPHSSDVCQECKCVDGDVHCELKECPEVMCQHPAYGPCCLECANCNFASNIYSNGTNFTNPRNICETCICLEGEVLCSRKLCEPVYCNNPIENPQSCCPYCPKYCMYIGEKYDSGETFSLPSDPCQECICLEGEILCDVKECPDIICSHPNLGNCCLECSNCKFQDYVYFDGESFINPTNPCENCICSAGNVNCVEKECSEVICQYPASGECCLECLNCQFAANFYMNGTNFTNPRNSCETCICKEGDVYCTKKRCEPPNCVNVIDDPESCCPYCANNCIYNGNKYDIGTVFPHSVDVCQECTCLAGDVHCNVKKCADTTCSHPASGHCCLECINCQFLGRVYVDGTNFTNPMNSCETCLCSKGEVACEKLSCVQCLHPISNESNCCPLCDGCSYAGRNYTNQERFISREYPCDECICKNGTVTCHKLACSLPACPNPITMSGVCCPLCPGCVVSGITFLENEEFTHPENVCEKCICKEGHVACREQVCGKNCTHPTPDTCCPICDSCTFETIKYANQEVFNPDPCRTCECRDGNVYCASEVCPEISCQLRIRLPGQCCETCRGCVYEGTEYASDSTWISTTDPCLSCRCTGGTVSCTNILCPVECAEPVPVPGYCCPICPECESEGKIYKSGDVFAPSDRPCDICTCEYGKVVCIKHECPVLIGCPEESIRPPAEGECCETCAGFDSSCSRDQIGLSIHPTNDPCFSCQCTEDFMLACSKEICPYMNCPSDKIIRSAKECCPKCQVCVSRKGEIYTHGDSWEQESDPCTHCVCEFGFITCKKTQCPDITCGFGETEFKLPGDCCPVCASEYYLACNYSGTIYENGENWKPDPCTTCQCRNGKMTCHNERCLPLQCPSDMIRSVDPGKCCPKCIPRPATCIAFGDPHYRTFDGAIISFQGTCRYTLTADCYSRKFSVLVENNDRGFKGVSWTYRVVVVLQNTSVDLRSGLDVFVKGRRVEHLPYFENPVLYVEKTGSSILVTTDVGVQVRWNGDGYVEVIVSGVYRNKTCGLCGNFNNYAEDDMRTPTGAIVSSEAYFGNSWKYNGVQPEGCTEAVDIDPCSIGGYRKRKLANSKCSVLKQSLFAPCHPFIAPEPYFATCVYDVCACSENDDCLCDVLSAYSQECSKANFILNWRSEGLCGIYCSEDEGLVFDECGPACPRTCENKNLPLDVLASQCFKPCVPGCQCSADKVLHNGRCIRPEFCP